MRFDDLDTKLRKYETAYDFCIPPENYIVVRLDGRGFTRLTKEIWQFEAPFDVHFRDLMVETTAHLLQCGFNIIYGYTQSDEISLLFHLNDDSFNRKERKILSILAGEASAKFSVMHGQIATFDARVCILPNQHLVDVKGLNRQEKHDLLFSQQINFNELPAWQKRGTGIYWKDVEKTGLNPKTGEPTQTTRRQLFTDFDLPLNEFYSEFIHQNFF